MKGEGKARILRFEPGEGRRILAVSDIHGNLPYLRGLLEKAGFCGEDELIIDGDFLEKGSESLNTLHYIMALCKKGNCHVVCGNCDDWDIIYNTDDPDTEAMLHGYVLSKSVGLVREMCAAQGIDPASGISFREIKQRLKAAYAEEWAFLASLPHAIETEKFIFAHGGCVPVLPLEEHTAGQLQHCDGFMSLGRRFDKWVIVGHWPVMLYGTDTVCANPVIDRESRIISIDGGCVLKDDGQLNALIIPNRQSEDFDFIAYDPFPVRRVLDAQEEGERSYYIRWGDNKVQVLERGEEFSRCRHVRTGYEMDILTKYLYSEEEFCTCNDCTDYRPALMPGDEVSVVEESSRGYFVKYKGVSGWYAGRLE